jgi:signal transduction histidine kinase
MLKLRTKFLLSFLLVSSALTCATLLVVRRAFQLEIESAANLDLHNSVIAFQNFERGRQQNLTRSAELLANLPNLKALMTSSDAATIQDGSGELWPLVGSDLMMLTDQSGRVVGLHTASDGVTTLLAQKWVREGTRHQTRDWWFVADHLFEVFSRPIYSGSRANSHLLGVLFVGWEVNEAVTNEIVGVAGSQVVVTYGDSVAATTIHENSRTLAHDMLHAGSHGRATQLAIADQQFLSTAIDLDVQPVPVRLIVLKSFQRALSFLRGINELLLLLGVAAIVAGCALIYLISLRFTRPLERLVDCARALGDHDFNYPLEESGADEIARLTGAFIGMRTRLKAAQGRALQAERMATIGRMASSISHDLRHRLTAIIANAEFLAGESLVPRQRKAMYAEVSTAVSQMTDMLESLLDLSRTPESLKLELIDVRDVLQRAIRAIRTDPGFRAIPIAIDADCQTEGHFDARKVERVFYNLLLNACEMLPRDGGLVRVAIRSLGDTIEIRISDTGPGIPDSIRHNLFQPFVSFGKHKGSGLGLTIVQKTCQDHGGEVCVENTNPGQTTFKIVLPTRLGMVDERCNPASPTTANELSSTSI